MSYESSEQKAIRDELEEVEFWLNSHAHAYFDYWNEWYTKRRSKLLKHLQIVQMRDWNI